MTGQCVRINQLVEIVDCPHVLYGLLNSFFKLAFKIRTLLHLKKKKKKKFKKDDQNQSEYQEKRLKRQMHQYEGSPTDATT